MLRHGKKGRVTLPTTPVAKLTGHNGSVHAVTYSSPSSGSQYILTGSTDRLIRLFNPSKAPYDRSEQNVDELTQSERKGEKPAGLVQTYTGHAHEVLDLAVASDNSRFASVGGHKNVVLWDVAEARVLRRWEGHAGRVNCVAWGGSSSDADGVVVSGSFDTTVKLWDTRSNSTKPLMTLSDAKDAISCVEVVDAEVYAGSVDGRVRVYDVRMGSVTVDVIGNPVNSITPTRQNDAYLVSTLDSRIRLMDKTSGKILQALEAPEFVNVNYRLRSTLAANGSLVVSGAEDGRIFVWDVLNGSVEFELWHDEKFRYAKNAKRSVVSIVRECEVREEWCSAGGDGTVVIWGHKKAN